MEPVFLLVFCRVFLLLLLEITTRARTHYTLVVVVGWYREGMDVNYTQKCVCVFVCPAQLFQ